VPGKRKKNLKRHAGAYGLIDEMNYQYKVSIPNQLDYIDDSYHDANANDLQGQQAQNYDYTVLGELKSDTKECIDLIEWNSQGKVTSIVYNNSCSPGKPLVKYHYDAFGNRIWKETRNAEEDGLISRTVYIRDAGGRELATYTISPSGSNLIRELDQQAIYGLSRIGVLQHTNFVKTASCTTKICTLATVGLEQCGHDG
jgi:hypothetical protein